MATNLLEAYKSRLAISENVYKQSHNGQPLDEQRKIMTAVCLNNISKYLNEAYEQSIGTQRSDMGFYKKFCLNLTTVTIN